MRNLRADVQPHCDDGARATENSERTTRVGKGRRDNWPTWGRNRVLCGMGVRPRGLRACLLREARLLAVDRRGIPRDVADRAHLPIHRAVRQLRPSGGLSRFDEALDMQCCPGLTVKAAGFASVRSWRPGRCPRSARTPRARPPRGPAGTGTSPGTAWSPDTRGRGRCPPSHRRGSGFAS